MPATRDGKLWRSQFYYKDWQGIRRKKNKRGFKTRIGREYAEKRTNEVLKQKEKRMNGKEIFSSNSRRIWILVLKISWKFILQIWRIA